MTAKLVQFTTTAGLGRLTLSRPSSSNAASPEFIADLNSAVREAEVAGCSAILVSAQGANFCVGADLKHFARQPEAFSTEFEGMANGFHDALARLSDLPVPIIAAVQGAAVGAGFGLMLSTDYVVCADNARFSTGYARLGLSADAGVSYFLTRALGVQRARSLLMTAKFLSSDEALALSLVDEIVPLADFGAHSEAVAKRFADGPTAAYAAIKRLTEEATQSPPLRQHLDRERDELLALAKGDAVAQAIKALLPAKGNSDAGH